eukprot:CAMPEP_0168823086 /NCGR_PEP_ID=MMETSP0726-20121227/10333_1 /TAXON_ID=265536 /ORGANISM="Amphiprora sp., Strain CCMP467" /LENGTH=648 /DNA_ID=CAMNT_0008875917 /DNA_START=5 /DNA_END=1949 /DNA_ORIENTATION=+
MSSSQSSESSSGEDNNGTHHHQKRRKIQHEMQELRKKLYEAKRWIDKKQRGELDRPGDNKSDLARRDHFETLLKRMIAGTEEMVELKARLDHMKEEDVNPPKKKLKSSASLSFGMDGEKLADAKQRLEVYERELNKTDDNHSMLKKAFESYKELLHWRCNLAAEDSNQSPSIAPSQLDAENLEHARGKFRIHNRDSGVARHPVFFQLIQAMSKPTLSEMPNVLYQGDDRTVAETLETIQKIDEPGWKWLVDTIVQLSKNNKNAGHASLSSHETFYSETIARALNGFCQRQSLPFSFSHQFSCAIKEGSSRPDTVDIAAFWRKDAVREDCLLSMIEVKKSDGGSGAKYQLCGYVSGAAKSNVIKAHVGLSFGLTVDNLDIRLYGLTWNNARLPLLEHALLCEARIDDSVKLWQGYFLCLSILTDENIREKGTPNNFCPGIANVTRSHPKVFQSKDKGTMYKVFDYGKYREGPRAPNVEVARALHDEKNVEVIAEYSDLGVSVLKMPWLAGKHWPENVQQMMSLCQRVQTLHEKKLKHGDILCQNIVFCGEEANLIDFDFAHLAEYPANWNTKFLERHPDSSSNMEVRMTHDVYAVIAILCHYFELSSSGDDQQGTISNEFVQSDDMVLTGNQDKCPFTEDYHPYLNKTW